MRHHIFYILQEKQKACAWCGCVSQNKTHGAFGFESDYVAENFRMEGKASRKTAAVIDIFKT
jgi:hypothetical protein